MRYLAFLLVTSLCVGKPEAAFGCINDSRAPAREVQFKSQYKLDEPATYTPPGTENPNSLLSMLRGLGLSGIGVGLIGSAFWLSGTRRA